MRQNSSYLIKEIMCGMKECPSQFIFWRLQNIAEKNAYRIEVELWTWRVVISLKLNSIFATLNKDNHCLVCQI